MIDQAVLSKVECHGKNLFFFFNKNAMCTVVHVHFGMSGAFPVHSIPASSRSSWPQWALSPSTAVLPSQSSSAVSLQEDRPEWVHPTNTTRLTLFNAALNVYGHLSAMTVTEGSPQLYVDKISMLGPDPLREDAKPELMWDKMQTSARKKSIGLFLMSQDLVAGVGNIYRSEILFMSGVHPDTPAGLITPAQFSDIWRHCVETLQRGFREGSIITVDPQEALLLGPPWTRRYCYGQKHCGRCGTRIQSWDIASRTVYCCTTCQPRVTDLDDNNGANKEVSATPTKKKKKSDRDSVCVCLKGMSVPAGVLPGEPSPTALTSPPATMTVAQLKSALRERVLETSGLKADLIARLEKFEDQLSSACCEPAKQVRLEGPAKRVRLEGIGSSTAVPASAQPAAEDRRGMKLVKGGRGGGAFKSAKQAAAEKVAAGESRAVEHIAVGTSDTWQLSSA